MRRKKIRILIAPEPAESGSTCLAMLADYYGRPATQIHCARVCGVSSGSASMEQIREGADALGLDAEQKQIGGPEDLKGRLPCVVTVNDSYAVLERIGPGAVTLCRPDSGRTRMPRAEFEKALGETALFLSVKAESTAKREKPIRISSYIRSMIMGEKAFYAVFYILVLAALAVILLTIPKITESVIDTHYAQYDPEFIREVAALDPDLLVDEHRNDTVEERVRYLGELLDDVSEYFTQGAIFLLLLMVLLEVLNVFLFSRFSANVSSRCRKKYVWSALSLPIDLYQIRSDGYFLKSATQASDVGYFLSKQVIEVILRPMLAVCCLFIMAETSVACSLVVCVSILLLAAATYFFSRFQDEKGMTVFANDSRESSFLLGGLKAIRTIRNSGSEFVYFREYVRLNRNLSLSSSDFNAASGVFEKIPATVSNITKLVLILTGALAMSRGNLGLGSLVLIHGIYCVAQDYIRSALHSGQDILSIKHEMTNLAEINRESEAKQEGAPSGTLPAEREEEYCKLRGDISIRNVSFGYSKQAGKVLDDISMEIPAGSSVAIVGSSGSGKTTLKKLICGRFEPWEGRILFDGRDLGDIPEAVRENSISAVDQQIIIFEDTVMNNIKMWDRTQLDADAILAARDAKIHDNIVLRENGYRHRFAEDGSDFSGGQRQRVEIARALSTDPSILVMDEATSALDTIVEKTIMDQVRERGITVILVAHRLSTIRHCDRIFVLDQGRIAGQGTHDELMESCELYRTLVTVE